jgi:hypothetical protein
VITVSRRGRPRARRFAHDRGRPHGSRFDDAAGGCNVVDKGARVTIESEKVGVAARTGVVTAVHGSTVQVRWDDGHETTFVPAAGAMHVEPGAAEDATP